jgi:hypothetical protein
MCLGYSLLRAPVPGPNEPHYLAKARHYWDPEWCAGDLFLESSNPHAVFYALIGWLPGHTGFETTAIIGRIAAALLMSAGWFAFISAIRSGWLMAVLSMGLLLTFQALGSLSGEWLVGGVEAKTFSYGLAFLGWGLAIRGRHIAAGASLGLSFSLHPIVGAWVLLATLLVLMWGVARPVAGSQFDEEPTGRSSAGSRLAVCVVTAVAMLPGVWACLPMLAEGSSPEADLLQVGRRLAHHLDPLSFSREAWRYYAMLLAMWGLAAWIGSLQRTPESDSRGRSNGTRFLRRVVAVSMAFALAGVAIAWGDRPFADMPGAAQRAALLKFYPFRLVDVLLPAAVAIDLARSMAAAICVSQPSSGFRQKPSDAARVAAAIAIAVPLLVSWRTPYDDRPVSRMNAEREADWREICAWINEELPSDAVLWASNENWAVKWFAERAEYVNYKDCPQDPDNLLEWQRRLTLLAGWTRESAADSRFSIDEFDRLHVESGITHILCSRFGPMPEELRLLMKIGDFKVYTITPQAPSLPDSRTAD